MRDKGQVCITDRGKGRWQLKFDATTSGKRVTRYVTIKGTRAEAEKELRKLLVKRDEGTLPEPSQATLEQYLSVYLANALDRSPKTRERYEEIARHQIIPFIGHHKLAALHAEQVETWHAQLIGRGLAPRTITHAHRLLSLVLARAVKNRKLNENVATLCRPPKVEGEIEILKTEEIAIVLDRLVGHRLHPIASLALATGKRGELLALQWSEVDLDRAVLRVEETKAGLRVKPPKTKRGKRNISLPVDAVTLLREHRKKQIELRLALGQGGQPVLVFSDIEGNMLSPNGVSRSWRQASKARKLPRVAFHALRHTHASTLIWAGVDILTVSRRLGHSSASMTLDIYGHLIEGADAAAAEAIGRVLK